ncbi:MAG: hypothetical protein IKJ68_00145 [Clostridia bacterium]|nr:hypothetical protein [Clostridia bacterium]
MIGVGIDVAKAKSMVAILSDDGEIIKALLKLQIRNRGFLRCAKLLRNFKTKCIV